MSTYQKKRFLEILSQKTLPKLEELNDLMLKREFTSNVSWIIKEKRFSLTLSLGKREMFRTQIYQVL